jgi:hypothetical protein
VRKARKQYEKWLAEDAKDNSKVIWQYIKLKSKTRQRIGDLCTDQQNPNSEKKNVKKGLTSLLISSVASFTEEPKGDTLNLK